MVQTLHTARADVHMHRLYAEHAALPVGVVTQCAKSHAPMVQAAWSELPGSTWAERVQRFFTQGEECLFDLLSHATTRGERLRRYEHGGIWAKMLAAGPRVIDFGGGLGMASSLLCDAGKNVTYVDVDGAIVRFASWYFEHAGHTGERLAVRHTLPNRPELPDGLFDVVLAENVLEYVADPIGTVEALATATGGDGLLYVSLDVRPETAAEPHRHSVDVDRLLQGSPALRAMEHVSCSDDGRHLFAR